MHGKGTFYYRNGKPLYEGEWKNGKFEGFGKQYSETGEYYVGEFKIICQMVMELFMIKMEEFY